MRAMFFLLALSCARFLGAQTAAFTPYGHSCGNWGSPPSQPQIVALGTPKIGARVLIDVVGVPRYQVGQQCWLVLFTGTSRSSWLGQPLPYALSVGLMNTVGCDLLCSVEIASYGDGVVFDIPEDPRLVGVRLYHQWFIECLVRGIPIFGFRVTSNAGEMTIGW